MRTRIRTHTCALCHLIFRSQAELALHIREDHTRDRRRRKADAERPAPAPAGR
jgi:hypothetical protein